MRVVRRVRQIDDLERLAPEWRQLASRAPHASVFQLPEWGIPWWRAFGDGVLHVLAEEDGGEVRAIAPLFVRPATEDRPPTLALIGTGNSDCLDALADSPAAAARLVAVALDDAAGRGWSIEWRRLPQYSLLLGGPGIGSVLPDVPCPVVALPAEAEKFERRLDADFLKKLRSSRRRLDRVGTVSFETVRGDEVQRGLDDLFRLHAERWALKGHGGVLADAKVQSFHRSVAARLDAAGTLRLVRMHVGRELAAVYYGFQMRGIGSFYLAGFTPRLAAFSPGSHMLREVLRVAIEDGVSLFDFLSGQESYKYRWGAVDRPFFTRLVGHEAHAVTACARDSVQRS